MYVGKNTPPKNVPLLQAIADETLSRCASAWFVILGHGMTDSSLVEWAAQWQPRVRLMGPQDTVFEILSCADVLILTSDAEGCPNVVLEAMTLGVPVVTTDVGDCSRLIEHRATGLIFPRGHAQGGSAALEELLRDPELRRTIATRGQHKASADHRQATMVRATLEIYRELLSDVTR
jgi:glycosyltransferase involved in cell wall biosynthesis